MQKQDNYYDGFISSWTEVLEHQELFLKIIPTTEEYPEKLKETLIRLTKNRIKRAKWNITRAQNLKNLCHSTK